MGKVIGIIAVILCSVAYALLLSLLKKEKKYNMVKLISKIALPILIIASAFLPYMFNSEIFTTIMRYIGVASCLLLTELFVIMTCKSKDKDNLFKWIGLIIAISFILTWIIPYGFFSGGTFYDYGMKRLGLSDISTLIYNIIYFTITTIIYLFVVGGFYGVFSKTNSYQSLVNKFAKSVSNHKCLWTIIIVLSLVILSSLTKSILVLVVFLPFLVSTLLNAKFDKVTTMGITFGSVLVGTVAATYGTEGLYWFNSYLNTDTEISAKYRIIIALIALLVYLFYNAFRVYKMDSKKSSNEVVEDVFAVDNIARPRRTWAAIMVFIFMALFVIVGFIDWKANFGIELFDNIHTAVTEFGIGPDKSYKIATYVLGGSATALGTMEITSLIAFLFVMSAIVGLMNKVKFNDFMGNYYEGLVKMAKPVCLYVLSYMVFLIAYMSPYTATISEFGFSLTSHPVMTTITSFVTSIFHADLGYTSYLVGSVLTTTYADKLEIVHTIYVVTYGLVQVLVPTSGLLLVGLSYTKVDYKSWFKYIWIFVAIIFACLIGFAIFC